jgi:transcriptional regulator with XRE-family HTH domain
LPFCYFSLSAKRPPNSAYPEKLVTLGDHLRKRRLDLGLYQKDVAVTIGVDSTTVYNWENNRTTPPRRFIPRIINLLGYGLPLPQPKTLGERITRYRSLRGISQKELADEIEIDPGTLSRMERSQGRYSPLVLRKVTAFFGSSLDGQ